MDDMTKRLNKTLGGIEVPEFMHGDNLAIGLCTLYENADEEPGENGWTESAERGCDAVLQAIRAHYAPLADRIEADAARVRELEALVREALPERLTEEQLNDACLSYRHDFGLLDSGDRFSVRFECAEWWRAIRKALLARMGERDDRS